MSATEIRQGYIVKIADNQGHVRQGPVISAYNYGTVSDPIWYIELGGDNGAYWKQDADGGRVIEILPPNPPYFCEECFTIISAQEYKTHNHLCADCHMKLG